MTRLFVVQPSWRVESFREYVEAFPAAVIQPNLCQYCNNCLVPTGCVGAGPAAQLSAKAQHHSTSVWKVDGHLARQGEDGDSTERCVFVPCSLK